MISYDAKAACRAFSRGDWVWLYNPPRKKGISPKLSRPWKGPYLVIEQLNNVVYRIQQSSRSKPPVVQCNRLWPSTGTQGKSRIHTDASVNTESHVSSMQQPVQEELCPERSVKEQEHQHEQENREDTDWQFYTT